jgi:hypothetical protein
MSKNTSLKNETKTKVNTRPQAFKEGNPGGPGRPPGSKNYLTQLEEAITKYENDNDKKIFDRLIQRAFVNDNVLLNVVKKFIPDKTSNEITTPEGIEIVIKHES